MKKQLLMILGVLVIVALVYFLQFVSKEAKHTPGIIEITSPTKSDTYRIGDTINIHLNNPASLPEDSLQKVYIIGSSNGFAVKNGFNGTETGISDDFQFIIPRQSCGEDTCASLKTGKYTVTSYIYSHDVFKLGCIDSQFCAFPDSYLLASGKSEEFIIDASSTSSVK